MKAAAWLLLILVLIGGVAVIGDMVSQSNVRAASINRAIRDLNNDRAFAHDEDGWHHADDQTKLDWILMVGLGGLLAVSIVLFSKSREITVTTSE